MSEKNPCGRGVILQESKTVRLKYVFSFVKMTEEHGYISTPCHTKIKPGATSCESHLCEDLSCNSDQSYLLRRGYRGLTVGCLICVNFIDA